MSTAQKVVFNEPLRQGIKEYVPVVHTTFDVPCELPLITDFDTKLMVNQDHNGKLIYIGKLKIPFCNPFPWNITDDLTKDDIEIIDKVFELAFYTTEDNHSNIHLSMSMVNALMNTCTNEYTKRNINIVFLSVNLIMLLVLVFNSKLNTDSGDTIASLQKIITNSTKFTSFLTMVEYNLDGKVYRDTLFDLPKGKYLSTIVTDIQGHMAKVKLND